MQDQQQPNRIKDIRTRMGMTQQEFAVMLGRTQGNIGHYELREQTMPPDVARKLIFEAAIRGHRVTYGDIYGEVDAPLELAERKRRYAED